MTAPLRYIRVPFFLLAALEVALRVARPDALVDLRLLEDLDYIRKEDDGTLVQACVDTPEAAAAFFDIDWRPPRSIATCGLARARWKCSVTTPSLSPTTTGRWVANGAPSVSVVVSDAKLCLRITSSVSAGSGDSKCLGIYMTRA